MPTDALHHLIINLDVQESGRRTNLGQLALRDVVHDVVRSAFAATGIDPPRPPEDRGDGVLLVLPANVPKIHMLGRWTEELHQALRGRNWPLKEPVRTRIGIHAGEVHYDDHGVAGTDVNIACRLAGCEAAKGTLRAAHAATAVVAVSDVIYQSVVRHGGPFIDPDSYRRHSLRTAEYDAFIWLYVPGYSLPPRPADAPVGAAATSAAPAAIPTAPPHTSRGGIGSVSIGGHGAVVSHSSVHDIVIGESTSAGERNEC
jgi:hypothetical protein